MIEKIIPAQLHWGEDGLPHSTEFGDLYFSAEDGLNETRHVFLQGNDLENRWRNLKTGELFVMAETGFGSGLNLLAAAQLWQEVAHPEARLQFISIEQHPMRKTDLIRTHQHWGELSEISSELCNNYPTLTPGFHCFNLLSNIEVTLIFDEVESALRSICPPMEPSLWQELPCAINAWFLDGFAPAKNPQMWQSTLFPMIHRLSKPGTTAATFTAAGDVRRALQNWGFSVTKTPGFGRKREMLTAEYIPDAPIDLSSIKTQHKKPISCWALSDPEIEKSNEPIAIIGAGIAGATLANALAQRGKQVHLYESAAAPATGASGNPQVALYARLSPDAGDLEDFMLTAMPFSQNYYKKLFSDLPDQQLGTLCGLIQLARDNREREKMEKIGDRLSDCREFVCYKTAAELSDISGIAIQSSGLYFPQSGWVNAPEVCSTLLAHSNIQVHYNAHLESLIRLSEGWQLKFSDDQNAQYGRVVLCNAIQATAFEQLHWLPTKPIRGQISFIPSQDSIRNLNTVICRETQLTPEVDNFHSVGATYGLDDADTGMRKQDHQQNLKKLEDLLGTKFDADIEAFEGRASIRCATPDYLPIVGPVPKYEDFIERFARLKKDAKSQIPQAAPVEPGLYVNLGYGSRGFSYAPLCAEYLANQICGEIAPLPDYLIRSTHPARFLVRGLVRGKLAVQSTQ